MDPIFWLEANVLRQCFFSLWSPVIFVVLGVLAGPALAGDFDLSLQVSDAGHKQSTASAAEKAASSTLVNRPKMEAPANALLTAHWTVKCTSKDPLTDVLVHFYVVRIDKPGQAPPPLEPRSVVIESALTMDFEAGKTSSAELQFRPDGPGIFLVRVETEARVGNADHEDFAALDLIVTAEEGAKQ